MRVAWSGDYADNKGAGELINRHGIMFLGDRFEPWALRLQQKCLCLDCGDASNCQKQCNSMIRYLCMPTGQEVGQG